MDMISVGPSCPSPRPYGSVAWDDKGMCNVVQIFISHDTIIGSLQFLYADEHANQSLSAVRGNVKCRKFNVVTLDCPSEFLTWVSGDYALPCTTRILSMITFGTNKGTYGPFGSSGDGRYAFNYNFGPHKSFGGFHGSLYADYVSAIGIYFYPVRLSVEEEDFDDGIF